VRFATMRGRNFIRPQAFYALLAVGRRQ